ncbi:molybdopterin-guanine dinucleotide biosynthesis protein B [Chromobacterium vaccinii]|uniref:molybdopterin-guanine dinucleotide biosynthesis protein B n=1 Tax=Chromobacterium vaccinii TaxID=1108595 RepID=UPI003C7962CD
MPTVLGVCGYSGSGKTTLLEALLPALAARGVAVSVIKHSHHDIELDTPGKDSFRHRRAGAREVMVVSPHRFGLFAETERELSLDEQIARLAPCDLVLLEGQKTLPLAKLEVYRPALGKPALHDVDPDVIAVACDAPLRAGVPVLDLNDAEAVADFIAGWLSGAARV